MTGMYIKPAYESADCDERLVSIVREMKTLANHIQDAEWEGQDVSAMRQQFDRLRDSHNAGLNYQPLF
jgi:hypothetical protein